MKETLRATPTHDSFPSFPAKVMKQIPDNPA